MENQHRKIKGYRELSQTEIDLMNEVKTKGVELDELVKKIQTYLTEQETQKRAALVESVETAIAGTIEAVVKENLKGADSDEAEEYSRFMMAEPKRWASIGKTDLQTGLMALTRAIAQPGFF
ncbi:hypothetical protein D3C75_484160 [compost metagenome]